MALRIQSSGGRWNTRWYIASAMQMCLIFNRYDLAWQGTELSRLQSVSTPLQVLTRLLLAFIRPNFGCDELIVLGAVHGELHFLTQSRAEDNRVGQLDRVAAFVAGRH